MLRIGWLLLLAAWLAFPAHAAAPEIPEPLKPWVGWVLENNRDYRCPFLYNSFEEKRCSWPTRLTLDLQEKKAHFSLDVSVYAESWTQLPGDLRFWPQQVTAGKNSPVVLERNGYPMVLLNAGDYHVEGEFYWDAMPESLAVPRDSGLVDLNINGRNVPLPIIKEGQLWISQNEQQAGTEQTVENKIDLQVFRKIVDDVPLQVVTRIDIDVSGSQREITLPSPLLQGFIPLRLQSPLPARLETVGSLLLQVRPGHWQIELTARHPQELRDLALPKLAAPWPESEIWAFDARPYQRVVEIKNLPSIDPQQTNMPADWRTLPAYRIDQGGNMQFTVVRRGDSDPEPNKLNLQRRLWLDFDGGGYTVNDHVTGTMTQGRRLNALPEMRLGRVTLNGENQLVTSLPDSGEEGVEVRSGRIDLNADSRLPTPISRLAATGWHQHFRQISAELNLPPGWRLLGATGVDNVPDSWISRWTLLDLFVVLIASLAIGRLWNYQWGLFALITLGLIWHEPEAPRYVWLHILAAGALLKVLPAGKFALFVKLYRNAFWLALVLLALPFMVAQVRTGLYPQLENVYAPFQTESTVALLQAPLPAAATPPTVAEPQMKLSSLMESQPAKELRSMASGSEVSGGAAGRAGKPSHFERIDTNANIQTGPGLPEWRWRTVQLGWNGPVDSTQRIRLWLLPPALTLLLNMLRVMFVALLALLLFDAFNHTNGTWSSKSFRMFNLRRSTLLAIAWLPIFLLHDRPSHADFPSQEMLEALKERLLKAPECVPLCAQIPLMQLHIDKDNLFIDMQTYSQQSTAIPIPSQPDQWYPHNVMIDGVVAQGLFRGPQGSLWLSLPEGKHAIVMQGRVALRNRFSLPLPLLPRRVTVTASGWEISGVHENGVPDPQLQFTRSESEASAAAPAITLQPAILPPFADVERTLLLGVDWHVQTRVVRRSPPDAAIVLSVPLLSGESVTTADVHVTDRKVAVNMPPQQTEMVWDSILPKTQHIDFTAADTDQWTEVWRADVSPMWHLQSDGLPAVHQQNPEGAWLPEWRPWPGEKLKLTITRPVAVPGPTVTIDKSTLRISPGSRLSEAALEVQLRSSKGGQQVFTLPEDAELQSVAIDGALQPIRLKNRQAIIPIKPGSQIIQLAWRQNESLSVLFRTSAVNLSIPSVNSHIQATLGEDRWTLFTWGPRFGPAVLFWGVLAVIAIVAYGLGTLNLTPLKRRHWFLLLIGLSQIPLAAALAVVGWLLALGYRAEQLRPESRWFNAAQAALGSLTLLSLGLLFLAVQQGLLGTPDMQIAGNHSGPYQLNWYQDRSEAELPIAAVVSVPLFAYRVLMLAWSLWLALSLLSWLKWGWGCFSNGGLWKKKTPKKATSGTDTPTGS